MNSGASMLHCRTVRVNNFFLKKPVHLIDFTRTVHVNVNNNFFFVFLKKLV